MVSYRSLAQSEEDELVDARAQRIEVKIQGGTPIHGGSLCGTCRKAQRVRGMAESQEFVYCHVIEKNIRFTVARCSAYDDERRPSLYDMKEIAWQLVTKGDRQIGFVSAKDFRRMKDDEKGVVR